MPSGPRPSAVSRPRPSVVGDIANNSTPRSQLQRLQHGGHSPTWQMVESLNKKKEHRPSVPMSVRSLLLMRTPGYERRFMIHLMMIL